MKLHAIRQNPDRENKDFPDIVQLIKADTLDANDVAIFDLFVKYEARHLYDRLRSSKRGIHE
jgi:hypothetical protein